MTDDSKIGNQMLEKIVGIEKLVTFTGISRPMLDRLWRVRDFPRPEVGPGPTGLCYIWTKADVQKWLDKNPQPAPIRRFRGGLHA